MKLWDAATGQPLRFQLDGPADKVDRAALSPDGTHLAATRAANPTVLVWDLATGGLVTLEGPATQIARGVGFSPDGKRLVCTYSPDDDDPIKDSPRSIRIWDLATRQAVVTIDRLPYAMRPVLQPGRQTPGRRRPGLDSRQGVGCGDGSARSSLASTPTERSLWDVAFSPDGKRLAACGTRGFASGTWPAARRWPPGRPIPRRSRAPGLQPGRQTPGDGGRRRAGGAVGHRDRSEGPDLQGALRTGRHDRLQSGRHAPGHGGADGTLRLWDATARRDAVSIPQDGLSPAEIPELSPDGQTLLTDFASGVRRRAPALGHRDGRAALRPDRASAGRGQPAAWTADGKRLYLADSGKTIRVVDVASGKVVRTFPVDAETKSSTGYRRSVPMRNGVAHAWPGGTIQVRDAQTGALFRTVRGLDGVHVGLGVQSGRLAAARRRRVRDAQDLGHRDRTRDRGDQA